jgi:ketosteroid isomerase-like protein
MQTSYTTEDNKATLEKGNAAITNGDNEGFLAFCTEDTQWNFVGDKILRGKEEVRKWMATEYVVPPKFTVSNLVAEGDFVIALGRISMKREDGSLAHYAYSDVWRFVNGKMAELKAFVIETGNEADDTEKV